MDFLLEVADSCALVTIAAVTWRHAVGRCRWWKSSREKAAAWLQRLDAATKLDAGAASGRHVYPVRNQSPTLPAHLGPAWIPPSTWCGFPRLLPRYHDG